MSEFGFIIHPLDFDDLGRKFKHIEKFPRPIVEKVMQFMPPVKVSSIRGISSPHNEVEGFFLGCTLTSKQMLELPERFVLNKVIKTVKMAEKMGAKIVGLGAMTSIVGDAGITVAKNSNIPVTTGNSYTIATAVEGAKKASEMLQIDMKNAEVVVIGATGSIGKVCAHLMARDCKYLTLLSRDIVSLRKTADKIIRDTGVPPRVTNDTESLKNADIIISVTSSLDAVIYPEYLKPGALICDVARPRDVSARVVKERKDVLVIEGGLIELPGDPDLGLNFGYPPKVVLACMAETMLLALEERYENFTLGRDLTIEQVDEIERLAKKHGFKLAGFRSFERPLDSEIIHQIREHVSSKETSMAIN